MHTLKHLPAERHGAAGFSIIEALIASAILLIIALGLLPLFSRSISDNVSGNDATQATNGSRTQIEEMLLVPFSNDRMTIPAGADLRRGQDFLYGGRPQQDRRCGRGVVDQSRRPRLGALDPHVRGPPVHRQRPGRRLSRQPQAGWDRGHLRTFQGGHGDRGQPEEEPVRRRPGDHPEGGQALLRRSDHDRNSILTARIAAARLHPHRGLGLADRHHHRPARRAGAVRLQQPADARADQHLGHAAVPARGPERRRAADPHGRPRRPAAGQPADGHGGGDRQQRGRQHPHRRHRRHSRGRPRLGRADRPGGLRGADLSGQDGRQYGVHPQPRGHADEGHGPDRDQDAHRHPAGSERRSRRRSTSSGRRPCCWSAARVPTSGPWSSWTRRTPTSRTRTSSPSPSRCRGGRTPPTTRSSPPRARAFSRPS